MSTHQTSLPAAVTDAGTAIDGPALADGGAAEGAAMDGLGVAPPVQAPTATTATPTRAAMLRNVACIKPPRDRSAGHGSRCPGTPRSPGSIVSSLRQLRANAACRGTAIR